MSVSDVPFTKGSLHLWHVLMKRAVIHFWHFGDTGIWKVGDLPFTLMGEMSQIYICCLWIGKVMGVWLKLVRWHSSVTQAKSCWRSYLADWSHKRRRSLPKNGQASEQEGVPQSRSSTYAFYVRKISSTSKTRNVLRWSAVLFFYTGKKYCFLEH